MLGERYIDAGEVAIPRRWLVAELSATPHSKSTRRVFTLGPDDRDPKMAPLIVQPTGGQETTRLVEVSITEHDDAKFARTVTQLVQQVMAGGDHKRVLVVCNRVSRAAECAQSIAQAAEDEKPRELRDAQVELLTGRMRAVERDAVLYRVVPLVAAGALSPNIRSSSCQRSPSKSAPTSTSTRSSPSAPAWTPCANDLAGSIGWAAAQTGGHRAPRGCDRPPPEVKSNASDPIYGTSLGATWRALAACATATGKKGERWIDLERASAALGRRPCPPCPIGATRPSYSRNTWTPGATPARSLTRPRPRAVVARARTSDPDVAIVAGGRDGRAARPGRRGRRRSGLVGRRGNCNSAGPIRDSQPAREPRPGLARPGPTRL